MGYFPNGTSGMMYEERWCARCANDRSDAPCYVWGLHMMYNYEQCEETARGDGIKEMLNVLIPRNSEGQNEKCTMFRGDRDRGESANQRTVRLRLMSDNDLMIEAAKEIRLCAGDPVVADELEERSS